MNECGDEWMGRLRLAAVECNYKETDGQWKEQFIHVLNNNDMLAKIIRKLSKAGESTAVKSEKVLVWAKRVQSQRVQSSIITSLRKTKVFEKIKTIKGGQRHNLRKLQAHAKMPMKQSCSNCGSSHPPRQCLAYGKKCTYCGKINHFREVCRSGRNRTVHDLEQKTDQHHEELDHFDMVNINYIIFNSKLLVITANPKTLSNQVSIIVPYKVDTGSDGRIMPLYLYKRLNPRATKVQLTGTKNTI